MKKFCIAGRYGDILIAMPALRHIYETTGEKPKVLTSSKFGNVFDGVSYVDCEVVQNDLGEENGDLLNRAVAGDYKILRWWMCGSADKDLPMGDSEVTFRGKSWALNFSIWPNYHTSIWARTGVPIELMKHLPLVFDKRDSEREQRLVNSVQKKNKKNLPVLLYNFSGHSSPFAAAPEVMEEIHRWSGKFHLVDISSFKCERIYDLLGLFDVSKILITIDTSTLHLSSASKVKTIAYLNHGWASSVPSGNVIFKIRYKNAIKCLPSLSAFISSAINT